MQKSWILVSLINFLIAALMGLMMRFSNLVPQMFDYVYLMHAHSHTAMLGWVYMMIYCLFVHQFTGGKNHKKYNILFWLTKMTVFGMMISFPIQGYGFYSIAFSSLHILFSYGLCFRIWKDNTVVSLPVRRFLYTAILFMLLSTIGAWSLGIIATRMGTDAPLYKTAIQFFLHFQFNGWFVFAVLSIFFSVIYKQGIFVNEKQAGSFHFYMVAAAIFTFSLPLSWYFSYPVLFYVNCLGAVLQVAALYCFIKMLRTEWQKLIENLSPTTKGLLLLSLISFVMKILMQVITIFPDFTEASHAVRSFTIGFIHLGMLGVITGFLLFFLSATIFIGNNNNFWKSGIIIFYIGFLLTELILFFQGMANFLKYPLIPGYSGILFGASLMLPIGLMLIIAGFLKQTPIPKSILSSRILRL